MSAGTKPILVAAALALAWPAGVVGAQCLKQVEDMAAALGVSTALPEPSDLAEASSDEAAVDELAESDGVIAPPATGEDMPVLEPSAGGASEMETAPDIGAQPPADGVDLQDAAAAVTQVEALLTAARQAADAADEETCLTRLQEAAALAAANGLAMP